MSASEELAEVPPSNADGRVLQLFGYWKAIHPPDGGLPGRQRLDPAAISALLPFVWLADIQREPLRFRYRLLGTEHARVFGRDYTGHWLDETHVNFYASPGYPQYVAAAEQGRAGYRRGHSLAMLPMDYRSIERLLLPLAQDGKAVDMLLAISLYQRR
jgi:hypothetical protein